MSVPHRTYWTSPRRGFPKKISLRSAIIEYGTKLQQKNDIRKKQVIFFRYFYIFYGKRRKEAKKNAPEVRFFYISH